MKRVLVVLLLMAGTAGQGADVDKTLVSWVMLKSKSVKAGSVLTVQLGDKFDGIVFAEIAATKWMAGSNFYRRTNKDQKASPPEKAGGNTLVQMAIVYKGDRITIYRNGEEYSSYKTTNVDLLSSKDNFVVFGIRHVGGNGRIDGSIEDARIYDKALSVAEIRSLEPNKESSIKPYAWWDFEGKKVRDRTGRYPHSKMEGGARLAGGKLVLGRQGIVLAGTTKDIASVSTRRPPARKFTGTYLPETPEWKDDPPDNWLTYHLAHPGPGRAYPGDPNPAFYYKGRYHMHYIYQSKAGGGFAFAHVSSEDMVHWKWHPTVLVPRTTGHGMFSGTGFFTKGGRAAMIYHGQGSGRNHIAYALDDNLDKWTKPEALEPKDERGDDARIRHWDPDCWQIGDTYYALSGGKDPELMKSGDLKNWKYLGKLLHVDFPADLGVSRNEDISCCNIFKIGNKWMLLCISHGLGCRYYLGDFKDEKYLPEYHERMSHGVKDYFAPESMLSKDGRRVMWTWVFAGAGSLNGIQALPRELELPEDGKLRIRPLRELEKLRHQETSEKKITVKSGATYNLKTIAGDALEIELICKVPGVEEFGIDVLCDEKGENGTRIALNPEQDTLKVGRVTAPFKMRDGEDLRLRVFVDKNLVEVFANDIQAVFCKDGKLNPGAATRVFATGGDFTADKITGWKMKSAYKGKSLFYEK